MNRTNLIPAPRLRAKARALTLRRWGASAGVYAGCLALVYGGCRLAWGEGDGERTSNVAIAAAAAEVSKLNGALAALRAECATARQAARATDEIAGQPDWSPLLARLAADLGDDVVLRQCELSRGGSTGTARAAAASDNAGALALRIDGLGRSQEAVGRFVLRMERLGLFTRVRLLQSNREPAYEGEVIGFRLECALGEAPGEAP